MGEYVGNGREAVKKNTNTDKPKTFLVDGAEVSSDAKIRTLLGAWYVFIGGVVSIGVFELAYWIMSNLNVHFIFESFVALLFSVLAIKMWDAVTGKQPTLLKSVVTCFTVIIFVLSLFIGFNQGRGVSSGKLDHILWTYNGHNKLVQKTEKEKSEKNGIVKSSKENLFIYDGKSFVVTAKKFNPGDDVKVIVRQHTVKLNDELLEPGEYSVPVTGIGPLVFDRVSNAPANVEVYY